MQEYVSTVTRSFIKPGPFKDVVDKLVLRLHLKYLSGSLPSVSEEQIVRALNQVGDRIGLPEFGKTTELEFQLFRVGVLQSIPELNPMALTNPEDLASGNGKYPGVATTVTPAELAYLLCFLHLQKRLNPTYQLTANDVRARYQAYREHDQANGFTSAGTVFTIQGTGSFQTNSATERACAINAAMTAYANRLADVAQFTLALKTLLQDIGYGRNAD